MAYAAWSVVFGEQPSAAKWNILGTNDSTFNTLLGTYGVRNPYCFRAYASGATTISDGAYTKVLLATESYDYNNNFANSTYTVPVTGVYHFDGRVEYATAISTGVACVNAIYINGAAAITGTQLGTGFTTSAFMTVSGDIPCTAGDTIELYAYQDSAGTEATTTNGTTWLDGHLVHAV